MFRFAFLNVISKEYTQIKENRGGEEGRRGGGEEGRRRRRGGGGRREEGEGRRGEK